MRWKDRRIERENTFNVLNNKDGTITLIPVQGEIIQPGTALNAKNLNAMEDEINESLEQIDEYVKEDTNDYSYTLGYLNGLNNIRTRAILNVNGFYSMDDGTNGKYRVLSVDGTEMWTDIKNNNNETIFQLSSLGEFRKILGVKKLRVMTKEGKINVKLFGAKGDGLTNDTLFIQAAINSLGDNGGGIVEIPKGTHIVSTVKNKSRVKILGMSWYSIIKSIPNNIEKAIVQLADSRQIYSSIERLTIAGNKANQIQLIDGILIDNTSATNDAHHLFRNVMIEDCSGNGFNMPNQSRENRLIDVFSQKNNGHGFNIQGTDNVITHCTSAWNELNGYNLINAYSNKLSINKAFGNKGYGFLTKDFTNLQMNSCDAQENGKSGFKFENMGYTTGSDLNSDTNSTASNKLDVAYDLENSHHMDIQGLATNGYNLLGNGQGFAVRQKGLCYSNNINIKKYGNQKPIDYIDDKSKDISNRIEINNIQLGLINLQTKQLISDSNGDGISDVFDNVEFSLGITGSKKINYEKQAQEISIYESTISNSSANSVTIEKTININAGLNLSLEMLVELSNKSNTNGQLILDWKNSIGTTLSSVQMYGNDILSLKGTAPADTTSVKIRLKLYPLSVGSTGSMFIKSFKYGIF